MTSNSTNYSLNGEQVVRSAFQMIGVAITGEPLEPEELSDGILNLNVMMKAMQQKLNIWNRKSLTIPLTLNKTTYTIGQKAIGAITRTNTTRYIVDTTANFIKDKIAVGDTLSDTDSVVQGNVTAVISASTLEINTNIFASIGWVYTITDADISSPRPFHVLECSRRDTNGNEVDLEKLTRNEYESLSNKTTPGAPLSYHYDPTIQNGTLYIWQSPDVNAVNEWEIDIVYQSPIQDVDLATDLIDIPSESYEALIIGLAYRLSWRFGGLTSMERNSLKIDAKEAMDLASSYEQYQGEGSVYAIPEIRE